MGYKPDQREYGCYYMDRIIYILNSAKDDESNTNRAVIRCELPS